MIRSRSFLFEPGDSHFGIVGPRLSKIGETSTPTHFVDSPLLSNNSKSPKTTCIYKALAECKCNTKPRKSENMASEPPVIISSNPESRMMLLASFFISLFLLFLSVLFVHISAYPSLDSSGTLALVYLSHPSCRSRIPRILPGHLGRKSGGPSKWAYSHHNHHSASYLPRLIHFKGSLQNPSEPFPLSPPS